MVKMRVALFLLATVLAGCTSRQIMNLPTETLYFAGEASGGAVSLSLTGRTLLGVYSNRSTATLDSVEVPVGEHLPLDVQTRVVDIVDFAPPLSASFGRHVLAAAAGTAALLYEDRTAAENTILKLATREIGAERWTLNVLEPPGEPLAVLPSPAGGFDAFWAAGGLLWRSSAGASQPLARAFKPAGSPRMHEGGFTVYNADDGALNAVQRAAGGFAVRRFDGAGPVQSSLESPEGVLSVLSWDASTRRLLLLEEAHNGRGPARTTVTLCDDTRTVALLPGPSADTHLFLFDESQSTAGGRRYRVSLVAASAAVGKPGKSYRKSVLHEGAQPIEGFAALETPDALYVLVQSGGMSLIRAGIRGTSPVS